MPAKSGDFVMTSPNTGPSAGTKLMTPGGTPASRRILKHIYEDSIDVVAGFHNTTLPCKNQHYTERNAKFNSFVAKFIVTDHPIPQAKLLFILP